MSLLDDLEQKAAALELTLKRGPRTNAGYAAFDADGTIVFGEDYGAGLKHSTGMWKTASPKWPRASTFALPRSRPRTAIGPTKSTSNQGTPSMSDRPRNRWRFQPDAATAHALEQIALRENRTIANATAVLVKEAIAARRRVDRDVDTLVAVMRCEAKEINPDT
jgi:hypothetical protein